MSDEEKGAQSVPGLIRNYVSFAGLVITFTMLACIILLFLIDLTQRAENPYFVSSRT